MDMEWQPQKVIELQAPAKINFGLRILRKRNDGYHDIETIFLPLTWHDNIIVSESRKLFMTCSDERLPTDDRNLCMKAAKLLARHVAETRGAHIHLEKILPFEAGLGGGSSDAAATLIGLCRLWDVKCSARELFDIGS